MKNKKSAQSAHLTMMRLAKQSLNSRRNPKSRSYHAIIVGGGHNGLVAANYLADSGKKVLVLERRHLIGGAAVTEELFPGISNQTPLIPTARLQILPSQLSCWSPSSFRNQRT